MGVAFTTATSSPIIVGAQVLLSVKRASKPARSRLRASVAQLVEQRFRKLRLCHQSTEHPLVYTK